MAFRVETEAGPDPILALTVSDGVVRDGTRSSITIAEQTDYYVAAAFDVENGRVTYYAQDLTNDTGLLSDVLTHSFTRLNQDSYFQIGNAPNFGFGHVDGLIDEVRFSRGIVPEQDLLVNVPEPSTLGLLLAAIPVASWLRRRITEGAHRCRLIVPTIDRIWNGSRAMAGRPRRANPDTFLDARRHASFTRRVRRSDG